MKINGIFRSIVLKDIVRIDKEVEDSIRKVKDS